MLTMGEGRIDLSGKGFGFIATGLIRNVSTSYSGSQFQLRVQVMRHVNNTKYTLEEWYIEF